MAIYLLTTENLSVTCEGYEGNKVKGCVCLLVYTGGGGGSVPPLHQVRRLGTKIEIYLLSGPRLRNMELGGGRGLSTPSTMECSLFP